MKILLVTNKVKAYALGFRNFLEPLQALGHEVVWAADFSQFKGDLKQIPCQTRQISIHTNPFAPGNRTALRQLCAIIRVEKIEAVQCSTPIGGALGRIAAWKMKIRPVIYAAHGFLFFKGAPLVNRTVYKLEEIILAHCTDVLITITQEDLAAARKLRLRSGREPVLVHGAGVEVGVRVQKTREEKRAELDVPQDAFVIVSAGELNKNKNTQAVIQAIAKVRNPNVLYLACGVGDEHDALVRLASELGVSDQVRLLGYRTDVLEIMAASEAFVMPSFREGVPRALLEAMDLGLPCVGSRTRGLSDLIDDGKSGYLCNPHHAEEFAAAFGKLIAAGDAQRKKMGQRGKSMVGAYSSDVVRSEYLKLYSEVLQ